MNVFPSGSPSDFFLFIGRFHPLIVHFPIGLLLLAGAMEYLALLPRFRHLQPATGFVLVAGTVSAVVAAVLGYLLSLDGGYNAQSLYWHQVSGITVAVIATLACLVRLTSWPSMAPKTRLRLYRGLLPLLLVAVNVTGHLGANLTHGSTHLTEYAPDFLRSVIGLPAKTARGGSGVTDVDSAYVYADIIQPMLGRHCLGCHNADKMEGDLILETPEDILFGGLMGSIIKAGSAEKSELFRRITLPPDVEEFMPAQGKAPLDEEQIAIIEWWLDSGADFEMQVADVSPPSRIRAVLQTLLGLGESAVGLPLTDLAPVDVEIVQTLRDHGYVVRTIVSGGPYLDISWIRSGEAISDTQVASLQQAPEHIAWLHLANTGLTDAQLQQIGALENLTHLHLQQYTLRVCMSLT